MIDQVRPSVVQVQSGGRGGGTGVIWHATGTIITNAHVIGESQQINVALLDGRRFAARVRSSNPALDLAILEIDADGLPAALVDDTSRLRVGELVFAIGHPWGQRWVVTAGIISALGDVPVAGSTRTAAYIRSDVRLGPGNSGGPLLNARGALIGINAMIFGGDLAVAIPGHVASTWLAGLPSRRVQLGIQVQSVELPAMLRQGALTRQNGAVLVVGITPGGPASRAALLVGDVLVAAGGTPIESTDALLTTLTRRDASELVRLQILRGGTLQDLEIDMRAQELPA